MWTWRSGGLCGARLVTAQETEQGRAWKEVRIKSLTGGDPIKARFMRQDDFTFVPTFKIVISGNHKPNLKSVDAAMQRRVHMILFTNKPAQRDLQLAEKLMAEGPGILGWAIEGCLEWQEQGLRPPEVVLRAIGQYFSDQNSFALWLTECCDCEDRHSETHATLFASWEAWADLNGEDPGSSKGFSQTMEKAGLRAVKNAPGHHGKRGFIGVRLKPVDAREQWQNREDR
jgi:putative DNA primase/helicase